MKLYSTKGAPNPDRVTYFLAEKGKLDEVEIVALNLMKGEHRNDEYKKVNPLVRVPSLVLDDGTSISESRAICTYLENIFPEPNLMGATALEKAQIEMWDRRIELGLMQAIAAWFRHGSEVAKALEPVQCAEWAGMNEKIVPKMADFFDKQLGDTPYVAGERFTNADITLYITLGFGRYVRFNAMEGRPNLTRWFDDMKKHPMMAAAAI